MLVEESADELSDNEEEAQGDDNGQECNEDGEACQSTRSSFSSSGRRPSNSSGFHQQQEQQNAKLATQESRAVCHMRILLLACMAFSALGVGLVVFFYTSSMERTSFEMAFRDQAAKVLDALGGTLDMTLGAVDSHVIGLVSFARATHMEWPFVTQPDHAVKLAKIRTLSKAVAINQYMYVADKETRLKWENYSRYHDVWVQEGLGVQSKDRNYHGVQYEDYHSRWNLYDGEGQIRSYDLEGPFFPVRKLNL